MNTVEILKDGILTHDYDKNIVIDFCGDNSIVRIINPKNINKIVIKLGNNCKFSCDENLDILGDLHIDCRADNSEVTIGKNFICGQVGVQCFEESGLKLSIGNDCLAGWLVNFRMGDGHTIYDLVTKKVINVPYGISIGNHVWIGRNVILLKNASISDDSVVGMSSIIIKRFKDKNVVIAGIPGKIIRRGINWDLLNTELYTHKVLNK